MSDRVVQSQAVLDFCRSLSFVVLDGCDGVGKSTFASEIAAQLGWSVRHADYKPGIANIFEYYQAALSSVKNVVFDRSFSSETVYGPVLRAGSRLSSDQARTLAKLVSAGGGGFIHVVATPESVGTRLTERHTNMQDENVVQRLLNGYELLFADLRRFAPVLRIHTG